MKQTKWIFFSCFMVLLLMMSLCTTAFAESGNTTVTVSVPCTVSMQIGDHGKVTADSTDYTGNGSFQKDVGTVVAYTFQPDTLYAIDKVIYDGTDVTDQLSGGAYTAPTLDGNKALQVSFRFLGIGEDTTNPIPSQPTKPQDSNVPTTGDTTNIGLWIGLLLISVIGLLTVVIGKKRFDSKHNS